MSSQANIGKLTEVVAHEEPSMPCGGPMGLRRAPPKILSASGSSEETTDEEDDEADGGSAGGGDGGGERARPVILLVELNVRSFCNLLTEDAVLEALEGSLDFLPDWHDDHLFIGVLLRKFDVEMASLLLLGSQRFAGRVASYL
jgi:hypothetical protein